MVSNKKKELEAYVLNEGLNKLLEFSDEIFNQSKTHKENLYTAVNPENMSPFPPDWNDLVRLHKLIRSRKIMTIVEFGTGYSTLVMADAIEKNAKDYSLFVKDNIRRKHAFELHVIEADGPWLEIASERIPNFLKPFVKFKQSNVVMTQYQGQICTVYEELPNVTPDFIYIDGPDQFNVNNKIFGISTNDPDRVPMSGDLLFIENFLLPGTIVQFDGRVLNARFVLNNIKRNWLSHYDEIDDVTTLELVEKPIGKKNRTQLLWQLGEAWVNNA
jgi:hypothetical protein